MLAMRRNFYLEESDVDLEMCAIVNTCWTDIKRKRQRGDGTPTSGFIKFIPTLKNGYDIIIKNKLSKTNPTKMYQNESYLSTGLERD